MLAKNESGKFLKSPVGRTHKKKKAALCDEHNRRRCNPDEVLHGLYLV